MIDEIIKTMKEQERQAAMSHEHMVICEEHLAEQITKGVDDCPLDEYRSDMLMRALDTALGNLEIDKATFIKGWSRPLADNEKAPERKIIATKEGDNVCIEYCKPDFGLMISTAGDIIEKITKCGITKVTSLAATLTTILDRRYDKNTIKTVVTLLCRNYLKEDN